MSAFEPHVIAVEWVGVNNLSGTMNEISAGMTNVARQQMGYAQQTGRQWSFMSEQARIARRSFEYMVAGMGMYKVIQAFQNYRTFRSELGNLNANLQEGQGAINSWGQAAIDVSNKTATPLAQVVESFQNLAASFPELSNAAKRDLFPVMATIEARASQVFSTMSGGSSVSPQQFGSVILQAARSFYGAQAVTRSVRRNPTKNDIETTANQVLTALYHTPGTTGGQLVNYLPTLLGGARAGRFSLPEAMAMFTVAQRVGGRPAQTIQYLRQLMLRIRRPTAQEAPFFQQAGINPNKMGSMGGFNIVQALLQHAASLPGGVSRQQIQQMMRQGNTQGVNLTGPAAQFLQNAIGGRIQSLIAITQLSTGMGDLNKEVDIYKHHLVDVNKAYEKWLAQNQLTDAANKFSNFTTSTINLFNPLINLVAKGIGDIGKWGTDLTGQIGKLGGFLDKHIFRPANRFTGGALGYGAEAAGVGGILYGLRNAGGFGWLGRILMRSKRLAPIGRILMGRGVGEIGGTAEADLAARLAQSRVGGLLTSTLKGPIEMQAFASALKGTANGTPNAPFWVVIHPLSMSTVPALFGKAGTGPATDVLNKIEQKAKGAGEGAAGGAAAGIVKRMITRFGPGAAGAGAETAAEAAGAAGLGTAAATAGLVTLPLAGLGYDIWRMTHYRAPYIPPLTRAQQRSLHRDRKHWFERVFDPHNKTGWMQNPQDIPLVHSYLQATGGKIPIGLQSYFTRYGQGRLSSRQLQRDIYQYARQNAQALRHPMTPNQAGAFYKYINPIFRLGTHQQFVSRATQSGGYFAGEADLVINIEPTQQLQNLLKPQRVKAHIPVTLQPTSRGGRKTQRTR